MIVLPESCEAERKRRDGSRAEHPPLVIAPKAFQGGRDGIGRLRDGWPENGFRRCSLRAASLVVASAASGPVQFDLSQPPEGSITGLAGIAIFHYQSRVGSYYSARNQPHLKGASDDLPLVVADDVDVGGRTNHPGLLAPWDTTKALADPSGDRLGCGYVLPERGRLRRRRAAPQ